MQHSDQPSKELNLAREAVAELRASKTFDDAEEHWKQYLHRLERVWYKSSAHFKKSPKWNGWAGKYMQQRKIDPLLRYLRHARGAEEHSINEVTARDYGFFAAGPGPSGGMRYDMEIKNGVITHFKTDSDAVVIALPSRLRLLPVTYESVLFDPPQEHQSHKINPNNLIEIAELGIAFYADFLRKAEAFFVEK